MCFPKHLCRGVLYNPVLWMDGLGEVILPKFSRSVKWQILVLYISSDPTFVHLGLLSVYNLKPQ